VGSKEDRFRRKKGDEKRVEETSIKKEVGMRGRGEEEEGEGGEQTC
jgi:hypothetical protein